MMKKKVVVGMSGGVDSSVAAYLLKEQGFDVIGVTMKIWQDDTENDNGGCCGITAADDARKVCDLLGIPHYVLNFKEVFKKNVIVRFVNEYMVGRTPNPCILCNRHVKWESLLQKSIQLGAEYIATGHYARIERYPDTGRLTLKKSAAESKDQTYALYNLTQPQLERTLMPIGDYTKQEVRKIASDIGLSVANKPDSQEICFVPDNNYRDFLTGYNGYEPPEGDFVDENGVILGRHRGITNYTIGQRKGLGIAFGKQMFVKRINTENNEIMLSSNENLYEKRLTVGDINYMAVEGLSERKHLSGKIRYGSHAADCFIEGRDGLLICEFVEPQRAVTPGQSAVFYDGDYVFCGGVII